MERNELIKQAYAYGATVAFQEAGMDKSAADAQAVELVKEALSATDILAALKSLPGAAAGKLQGAGSAMQSAGAAGLGRAKGLGQAIGSKAQGLGQAVGDKARGLGVGMQDAGSSAYQGLQNQVAANPLSSLGIAGGAGAGLGAGGTLGLQSLLGNEE